MRRPHKPENETSKRLKSEDALQSAQYRRYLRETSEDLHGHYRD